MTWLPDDVRLFLKDRVPLVTDDLNDGFENGDCWVDEVNKNSYQCLDNTVGAADWAQLNVGAGAPVAHKDTHDPEDGSDPLDSANPIEISVVAAASTGTSHSLARADHGHQIQHSIANNHLATYDGTQNSGETCRMTANGVESRTDAEMKSQLGYLTDLVDDVSPQLGGNIDLNQKSIVFDSTPTDDLTFNGPSFVGTSGMALALYDVCILQSDGKYDKADGDAEVTTKGMCVMAAETFSGDADTGVFILPGSFIRDDTFNYTVGAPLYLSLTPGPPTETIPPDAGDFVRVMGYAHSADVIFFDPSKDYIERV